MINSTVQECIGTVDARYGCKILQYEYEATRKTEDYQVKVFLYCLDSTSSKIKLITINILFYENKTIGCTPYGYFVAGYISLYIGFCNRLCHSPFNNPKNITTAATNNPKNITTAQDSCCNQWLSLEIRT